MTEYRMPDPPEGYEWVVSAERGRDWQSIDVRMKRGEESWWGYEFVHTLDDAELNAHIAVSIATKILDYYNNPPQPPPEPSFNGLTGYRRG